MNLNVDILKPFLGNSKNSRVNFFKILKKYHNFQNNFQVINIVGTNGKGSTAQFLARQLQSNGLKIGLFSSPAILTHNERISINSKKILDKDLILYLEFFSFDLKKYPLNFFEIWTLIAIKYFCDQKIDLAVIEAGIGGIKDATFCFNNQIAILLTSVSKDHCNILGNEYSSIIKNKLGIRHNDNTPLFIANSNYKYLGIINKNYKNYILSKTYDKTDDIFQMDNIGNVISFLDFFNYKIFYDRFSKKFYPKGRFMILKSNPYIILDCAHNPDAIQKLTNNIKKLNIDNPIILFASAYKKDFLNNYLILNNNFSGNVFLSNFNHPFSWTSKQIKSLDSQNNLIIFSKWSNFFQKHKDKNIIICGSFYFIGTIIEFLNINKKKLALKKI